MCSSVNDLNVLGCPADYPHIEQSLSTYWQVQMTLAVCGLHNLFFERCLSPELQRSGNLLCFAHIFKMSLLSS